MLEINEIVVDDDVPLARATPARKRRRGPRNPTVAFVVDRFARMKPGQSFFVPDIQVKDLAFLRRPFHAAGLGFTMRRVECDEIYQTAGVRVWRQPGEADEL